MRWHVSLSSRTRLGIEDRDCDAVYQSGISPRRRQERGECRQKKNTMYMKSIIKRCNIPFVPCLPASVPISIFCSFRFSFIVLQFTLGQAKSVCVGTYAAGGTGSCRWACLLCHTSAPQPAVPGQHHQVLMPARPIADIRRVAQASRAQHCRLSDSRARNLSSSTRASAAKRAPPPAPSQTPSTTNRLCPCN